MIKTQVEKMDRLTQVVVAAECIIAQTILLELADQEL
jgi:hypothetical protein